MVDSDQYAVNEEVLSKGLPRGRLPRDSIFMDATAFGGGACALQVTLSPPPPPPSLSPSRSLPLSLSRKGTRAAGDGFGL